MLVNMIMVLLGCSFLGVEVVGFGLVVVFRWIDKVLFEGLLLLLMFIVSGYYWVVGFVLLCGLFVLISIIWVFVVWFWMCCLVMGSVGFSGMMMRFVCDVVSKVMMNLVLLFMCSVIWLLGSRLDCVSWLVSLLIRWVRLWWLIVM